MTLNFRCSVFVASICSTTAHITTSPMLSTCQSNTVASNWHLLLTSLCMNFSYPAVHRTETVTGSAYWGYFAYKPEFSQQRDISNRGLHFWEHNNNNNNNNNNNLWKLKKSACFYVIECSSRSWVANMWNYYPISNYSTDETDRGCTVPGNAKRSLQGGTAVTVFFARILRHPYAKLS